MNIELQTKKSFIHPITYASNVLMGSTNLETHILSTENKLDDMILVRMVDSDYESMERYDKNTLYCIGSEFSNVPIDGKGDVDDALLDYVVPPETTVEDIVGGCVPEEVADV